MAIILFATCYALPSSVSLCWYDVLRVYCEERRQAGLELGVELLAVVGVDAVGVGGDEDVLQGPERRVRGEGLRLEDVQGHARDLAALRRPDDVRRPDGVAAAEVVEEGGTLHQPEMPAGEEAVGLLGSGEDERHVVGLGQGGLETGGGDELHSQVVERRRHGAPQPEDAAAEGLQRLGAGSADLAVADEQDGLVPQRTAMALGVPVPELGGLVGPDLGHGAVEVQEVAQERLGHHRAVEGAVENLDAAGGVALDPVAAGGGGEDGPQPRRRRVELRRELPGDHEGGVGQHAGELPVAGAEADVQGGEVGGEPGGDVAAHVEGGDVVAQADDRGRPHST